MSNAKKKGKDKQNYHTALTKTNATSQQNAELVKKDSGSDELKFNALSSQQNNDALFSFVNQNIADVN